MSTPPPSTTNSNPPKLSTHLSTTSSPILIDGALATYLETLGADISSSLWSASILLSQPDLIQRTHLDYFRAGANIAITASYQASIPGLVEGLGVSEQEAMAIVRKSVDLARAARQEYLTTHPTAQLWIAGSVGPYGAYLANGSEYRGDYTLSKEEMKSFHRGRITALISSGADLLAIETIPSYAEAAALLDLLATEFPDTEAWFTFTLRDAEHIADGTPLNRIAELFANAPSVIGLGFNCVPDALVLPALKELKPLTSKALVVYPNSGEEWNAERREWEGRKDGEGDLGRKTREWLEAGARMIGGCCRMGPGDVKVMKEALEGTTQQ